ncbi:helix-turn-helix domain-containing protein [Glycomyces sp. A-F 0318]|uniref:helix-turn-helix domain-containing protein n=1 Tax=Glycomyces amatae TaxID=2881355 RepID=UPI001E577100|nr:helix-turn-helix transcriptional regulator [Glycomyces amatae]MCD0446433.1 helix-turn-helix domain-containing protein [Glycomyces amatae]
MDVRDGTLTIGERLRHVRQRRGMTQEALCALVGKGDTRWLRRIETGERPLNDINTIRAFARALDVSLAYLLGEPFPAEWVVSGKRQDTIPALRAALTDWRGLIPGLTPEPAPDLSRLATVVDAVWADYQESRYARVHDRLPALLRETGSAVRATSGPERRDAKRLAALTHQLAAVFLTKFGEGDLAWSAACRGLDLARDVDDSALLGALYRSAGHTLVATGDFEGAASLCEQAATTLAPVLERSDADGHALSMSGMLWLVGGLAAAKAGDRRSAEDFIGEAGRLAVRLGVDANFGYSAFGPTNTAMHTIAVEAELDNPQRALVLGERLDVTAMPVERHVRHRLELARARFATGDLAGAISEIRSAEQVAPEQARAHRMGREIIRHALRARVPGRETLDLAARMRLLPN